MLFQFIYCLFNLFLVLLTFFVLYLVQTETIQNRITGTLLMRKVHRPHLLVVNVFNWEISQQSSISHHVPTQIYLFSCLLVVDVVLSPFFLPSLGLKSNRKRSWELNGFADRQIRSGFLVEEPQDLVIEINSSTSIFNSSDLIELQESKLFDSIHINILFEFFLHINII